MKEAMGVYEEWRKALGDKGWKIDVGKPKGMPGSKEVEVKDYGKWSCELCKKNVGVNRIKCTMWARWRHKI